MIIKKVRIYEYKIPLKSAFKISFETIRYAEGFIVELVTENEIVGVGEASPAPKITGSTTKGTYEAIKCISKAIIGKELKPLSLKNTIDNLLLGNTEAKAAVEIAFLDAYSRELKIPLYKYFGGFNREFKTDITIGIKPIDETVKESLQYVEEGFDILKIKVGEEVDKDVAKIKKVRQAVGYDVKIRVDANQGWSPKQALKAAKMLEKLEVELIEQPMPYWMIKEHAWLRKNTEIPIALDESVHNAKQAFKALTEDACDIVNIKLMKSGGILEALKITSVCEASGVENMIGCMVETRVGITAAAHTLLSTTNIKYIDLDSDLTLKEDIASGGAMYGKGGLRVVTDQPGLGVELNYEKLKLICEIRS